MKKQTIKKGFFILSFAGIVSKLLSLLYIPLLLSIISEEGYGIYMASYQVYAFIYVLTNAGIPIAISKLVSEKNALNLVYESYKIFQISRRILIIFGLIFSVFMFVFSNELALKVNYEKASIAIIFLSPCIILTALASSYRGYFQGCQNMTPTAISQVIEQVFNTVFSLIFAKMFYKYGIMYAVAGASIGTFVGALSSTIYLSFVFKQEKKTICKIVDKLSYNVKTSSIYKQLFKHSMPITLCIGLQYTGNIIDLWNTKSRLLFSGLNESIATENFAYLAKFYQLIHAPMSIILALSMTILPSISESITLNNKIQLKHKVTSAFRISFLISIPCAIFLSILSKPIYSVSQLGEGDFLMTFGAVILVLLSVIQIQTSILNGAGKLFTITFVLIGGILLKLLINYYLIPIPILGIKGALVGSFVGFLVPLVINSFVINKTLKIKFSMIKVLSRILTISILMGIVINSSYNLIYFYCKPLTDSIFFLNVFALVSTGFISIFFYASGLIALKEITKKDLNLLPSIIKNRLPAFVINLLSD